MIECVCRKTELAFKSLSKRLVNGETEEEAANHTGIELTQAAEVCLLRFKSFLSYSLNLLPTAARSGFRFPLFSH